MDSRRKLDVAVAQVRRRLMAEWFVRTAVRGLAAGAVMAAAVFAASRLFVWPGYAGYAGIAAALAAVAAFAYEWRRSPSRQEAVRQLDSFSRDNVILAAETDGTRENPLSSALADAAADAAGGALGRFRKRRGRWTERTPLLVAGISAAALAGLALFPSSAQLEAQEAEKEREIIEDLADDVGDLSERAEDPGMEKRLADLADDIRSAESPEEAVREAVKLQRELSLRERLRERPGDSPGPAAGERSLTPGEAAAALAELSGDAEEQLAGMGRTSGAGAHASSGNEGAGTSEDSGGKEGRPSEGSGSANTGADGEGDSSGGNGAGESEGNGGGAQDGGGNKTESGNGSGAANGTGSGSGEDGGESPGSGSGGSGQGPGDWDRNLVSTPQSPPEPGDTVLDAGPQTEGKSAAESLVPAEKGEVRPYAEVQSEYRDAYVEHAGRLGLPEDLQQVLSDYFSSIDTRE
ncbi:hypothetical protein C772_02833 [Bhargavaea cecembensis DSE10]|uniref:Uncharacterized protein n=1 Tax=Bhargavaea cecembensis DSE10 TaxID=1235279 RepID=M7NDM6_9BACL|nr:hypothetical protein [Bhargavaea cecembensis]EMR05256.1 hypothetical protein C772_02833 [Bhargavaea cecembensis DSE10]